MNQAPVPVVVDASVGVKWVITTGVLSNHAQALLEERLRTRRPIVAPPHLTSEVTNTLYQRVRSSEPQRHITDEEAREALTKFLAYPIELVWVPDLYEHAFQFALQHRLPSVYDSLYVILARFLTRQSRNQKGCMLQQS